MSRNPSEIMMENERHGNRLNEAAPTHGGLRVCVSKGNANGVPRHMTVQDPCNQISVSQYGNRLSQDQAVKAGGSRNSLLVQSSGNIGGGASSRTSRASPRQQPAAALPLPSAANKAGIISLQNSVMLVRESDSSNSSSSLAALSRSGANKRIDNRRPLPTARPGVQVAAVHDDGAIPNSTSMVLSSGMISSNSTGSAAVNGYIPFKQQLAVITKQLHKGVHVMHKGSHETPSTSGGGASRNTPSPGAVTAAKLDSGGATVRTMLAKGPANGFSYAAPSSTSYKSSEGSSGFGLQAPDQGSYETVVEVDHLPPTMDNKAEARRACGNVVGSVEPGGNKLAVACPPPPAVKYSTTTNNRGEKQLTGTVATLPNTGSSSGVLNLQKSYRFPTDLYSYFNPRPWDPTLYRDIRKLCGAIHGEVRLACDRNSQPVVIKIINNSAMHRRAKGELENPLMEVGTMQYLFGQQARFPPHFIAKLLDVYRDNSYTYMVTEYCLGGELFREVVSRGYFHERVVKAMTLQLAFALQSLHKNGICHRDVSLENTLLHADRTIRLIDFGQAEPLMDTNGNRLRMTGTAGKAYYRAPEMLLKEYDGPPVDVFALGVQVFIMATGMPPWQEALPTDERYQYLTSSEKALNDTLIRWGRRDRLSDALVDLLTGVFIARPEKRPTIDDLFLHPWFAFDGGVWRWLYKHWPNQCVRAEAARVEEYLQTNPQGKWCIKPCQQAVGANDAMRNASPRPTTRVVGGAASNTSRLVVDLPRAPAGNGSATDRFHIPSMWPWHIKPRLPGRDQDQG